jgi:hypothetical protein
MLLLLLLLLLPCASLLLLLLHVHALLHPHLLLPGLLPLLLICRIAAGLHGPHKRHPHRRKTAVHHTRASKGRAQHAPKPCCCCCHGRLCSCHHHLLLLLLQHLQGLVPVVVDHGGHLQACHVQLIVRLQSGRPTALDLLLLLGA